MKQSIILFILLLTFTFPVIAEYKSAIDVAKGGLIAYKKEGAKAAVKAWIKGSGIENSKEALSNSSNLTQVEDYFGKYESFEIIKDHEITKKIHTILFVIYYEKGPLYSVMQTYKRSNDAWVVTTFGFNMKPKDYFPDNLVFGKNITTR